MSCADLNNDGLINILDGVTIVGMILENTVNIAECVPPQPNPWVRVASIPINALVNSVFID